MLSSSTNSLVLWIPKIMHSALDCDDDDEVSEPRPNGQAGPLFWVLIGFVGIV